MKEWFLSLADGFSQTFIEDGRWVLFAKGFGVTIRVAVLALLMGIAIGILVAIVRTKHDTRKKNAHGVGNVILNILNAICQVYLTVIRGTPMMVQLMIMYFCYLCIQSSFCCSSNFGFWYQFRCLCSRDCTWRYYVCGCRTDGGRSFSWYELYPDHASHYYSAGNQKYSAGTGQ